jgi:hypothetical protein
MPDLDLESIPTRYDEARRLLAAWHAADDLSIECWAVPDDEPDPEIRMIEVSENFPEAGVERPTPIGGREMVIPVFPLGRTAEFPFRSRVAQITPREWDALRAGRVRLTQDWDLSRVVRIMP